MGKHNLTMVHEDVCVDLDLVTAVFKNEDTRFENDELKKYHNIFICLEDNPNPIIYSSKKKEEIDAIYKKVIQI